MKLNNKRDKDCYVFMEDGIIREEDKDNDTLKIMNDDSDFDSSGNDEKKALVNEELYDNISKRISDMPKKKVFNRILIISISIILILLSINIIGLFKAVQEDASSQFTLDISNIKTDNKTKNEFFFLTDVIHNSNNKIKEYYDSINKLVQSSNTNYLSKDIANIQKNIQADLQDVERLNQFVNKKSFAQPIKILNDRFSNISELTNKILNSPSSQYINIYNEHARKEISFQENLTVCLKGYFEYFKIEYRINNENAFVYIKK